MWNVKTLDLGTLYLTRAMLAFNNIPSTSAGEMVALPAQAWLLRNAESGQSVLIDAGPSEYDELAKKYHSRFKRTAEQSLEHQLGLYGVALKDISHLILTHLHWDHAWGATKLPNAAIYVQREEMRKAITPPRAFVSGYDLHIKEIPPFFCQFYHQIKFVDGDANILGGISVLSLPGHTSGSQGVLVETEKGRCVFTGDLFYCGDNWEKRMPPGVFENINDYEHSFKKLEQLKDCKIIPGHDPDSMAFFNGE